MAQAWECELVLELVGLVHVVSVYTRRIYGPAILANTSLNHIYECPANTTTVIRNLALVNNSSTTTHVVRVGIGGVANANRILRFTMVPESNQWFETRIALHAGDRLYGYCDTVGSVVATITAYVLSEA